ncbi:MAG: precorrin-4 C(11)-methyltransferase [Aestuariivita sp.]|nr:precorrin-4 C(11)-methyltransferase [Aestuariivita sp.]MCY4202671.1 precorrin-4 C(11)-methyltransferase [Aestuariivita sp.]MCY4287309.1 precorrin-4 C(11)-methyltransferase [Aestuariivita sp.]MCY4346542.1 precorrin-4 C(11)-methyltransferase [Aestuariivita sp.]
MTVHFIGAGPGAPDLLTLRGRDILRRCPLCLYAGSLIPKAILDHCPSDARVINTAPMDLDQIMVAIREADAKSDDVARLHSGDLSIWSAMGEQIRRLEREKISYTVTPGVPSFAAAAAAIGQELTLPEIAQSVVLTRTPGRASAMPTGEKLRNFARTGATLAIHLSIQNLEDVVSELMPIYGADCPIIIVYHASCSDQQIIRGVLRDIIEIFDKRFDRTAVIFVGPALSCRDFVESCLYAPDYDRRYRRQDFDRQPVTPSEGDDRETNDY